MRVLKQRASLSFAPTTRSNAAFTMGEQASGAGALAANASAEAYHPSPLPVSHLLFRIPHPPHRTHRSHAGGCFARQGFRSASQLPPLSTHSALVAAAARRSPAVPRTATLFGYSTLACSRPAFEQKHGQGARGTGHGAQGTGHGARSTGHGAALCALRICLLLLGKYRQKTKTRVEQNLRALDINVRICRCCFVGLYESESHGVHFHSGCDPARPPPAWCA